MGMAVVAWNCLKAFESRQNPGLSTAESSKPWHLKFESFIKVDPKVLYWATDEITVLVWGKCHHQMCGVPPSVLQLLNMDYGVRVSVLGPLWVMKVPWAAWCRFKVQGNFLLLCSSTTFVSYSWQLNEALKSFMLFANPGSLSTKFQCLKCCVWMHQGKVLIIPKNVKIQLIAAHLMNDNGSLVARWAFWSFIAFLARVLPCRTASEKYLPRPI